MCLLLSVSARRHSCIEGCGGSGFKASGALKFRDLSSITIKGHQFYEDLRGPFTEFHRGMLRQVFQVMMQEHDKH